MSSVQEASQQEPAQNGRRGGRVDIHERRAWSVSGWFGVLALAVCATAAVLFGLNALPWLVTIAIVIFVIILGSLVIVQPGQTSVIQFFGRYSGTVRQTGLSWVIPLSTRRSVSVRVRNFETNRLKVNDADGNPVEIAAIVVWQVADTSKATYAVDDYRDFVSVQAESALRHTATTHPYDDAGAGGESLRGSTDLVASELAVEVAERVLLAGVEIVEVRISHLAYASEIAQAMLRRQQANAVVAARSRIVEGAVGMVEMALVRLNEGNIVELDDERKAAMVSNLMVVLCGDQPASPIVNAGSLY
ncbi:SPFH domain-containing protein [Rathayibacter soli]|uniref:SPFH domain-containing protein n=1 Tax=Rathayibacter soli TaxID=3144168 RepID=UPI0027E59644|nr:SPFH domain-containing protein [Glaciibacter superstes]